ncbi:ABC transporter permease [Telluribacter humicola]|uniref:ABC transporter permease n=1 Tax=Telluribacter humicola TaxID=1720261 RepID=UPI001E2DC342|nr:ABC transporter permease [Telluribacter humicola]
MNPNMPTPPRWAQWLLTRLHPDDTLEEVEGDLQELYTYWYQRSGKRQATLRYLLNVLSVLPPLVRRRKREKSPYVPSSLSPDMIKNYLKIAWRNLSRHKVSSLINLSGLTLGVTACLVIYLITSFELSFDTFHPDGERIYRVVGNIRMGKTTETKPVGFIPRAAPQAIRAEVPGIETVAAFHNMHSDVIIPAEHQEPRHFKAGELGADRAQIIIADPGYFDIFRYEWLAGSPQTSLSEPYKVVLSEQKARTYFGDMPLESMLGREVIYRDSIRTIVSGIVKTWNHNTDFAFTDFISAATIRASALKREINLDEWNDIWSASQTFVKLATGTTPAQVEARFAVFANKHFGPNRGTGDFWLVPALQPLSDVHFNEQYQDNYTRKAHLPTLYALMGVAVFILLIAAINFINLSTAQSVQRTQEIGIRKVLGSNRQSIIAQFMSETLLLTIVAVLLALLLTQPVLSAFEQFIPKGVALDVFNPRIMLFLLALLVMTTVLAGLYPSWVLAAYQPAQTLKGQRVPVGHRHDSLRKGLIVFQFTVSLVFIIGMLVIGRQLTYIRDKDLGFSTDAIVLINTPDLEKSKVLAQKIRQLTGVERVARQWSPPMSEGYMLTRIKYRGTTEIETEASAKVGDEHFVPLYELKLVAGRNIMPTDTLRELLINQTYARVLGFKQPAEAVGKLLHFNGNDYPVAGVVADFHEESLRSPIKSTFIAYIPGLSRDMAVKLATSGQRLSEAKVTLAAIEKAWQQVFPDEEFAYTFLDDSIAKLYEKEQKTAQLVNTATAIAILISCMGLFGLATFTTQQRTREIGVRKVLGASVASLVALLSLDLIKLVVAAIVTASPIAWYMTNRWLQDFAYKVDVEWWVGVLAGLLATGIALLTVSFQSVKAALMNPVKSLRSE